MNKSIAVAAGLLSALALTSAPAENVHLEAQLAWMSGSWHGQGLGGSVEEHWITGSGGVMTGMFRLVAGDKPPVLEYLMITEEGDRVVYRFKHFRSDYSTWETDRALEFTLIEVSDSLAVFHSEVPDQHSPRRLTYRLLSPDSLAITVTGSDEEGRMTDGFELRLARR